MVGLWAGLGLLLGSALAHLLLFLFTQWLVDVHCWVACEPVPPSQLHTAHVVKVPPCVPACLSWWLNAGAGQRGHGRSGRTLARRALPREGRGVPDG